MAHALDRHVALVGFMGAGKSTLGAEIATRLGRRFVDLDRELERAPGRRSRSCSSSAARPSSAILEAEATLSALERERPAVLALGGGAVETPGLASLGEHALTSSSTSTRTWRGAGSPQRPAARARRGAFRALYDERQSLYARSRTSPPGRRRRRARRGRDRTPRPARSRGCRPRRRATAGELVADRARCSGCTGRRSLRSVASPVRCRARRRRASSRRAALARASARPRRPLVAFGGGCTTDAAGFAAATFLRGVRWIAVPTTLVGQVDAAIGGKTALNLPEAKNLAGAFHWPEPTLIDPALLGTLPEKERARGDGRGGEDGLLAGEPLWELPDQSSSARCAAFKAAVCLRDPHERGEREILNLGHTFAHALEAAGGYDGPTHGEAVALGLLAALRLSELDTTPVERDARAGARARRPRRGLGGAGARQEGARRQPRLVLLEGPGKPVTGVELPPDRGSRGSRRADRRVESRRARGRPERGQPRRPRSPGPRALRGLTLTSWRRDLRLGARARALADCRQTNQEGLFVAWCHDALDWAGGVVVNPGAWSHYSYAIRDALEFLSVPVVEVQCRTSRSARRGAGTRCSPTSWPSA